jgi:hypothetical protein
VNVALIAPDGQRYDGRDTRCLGYTRLALGWRCQKQRDKDGQIIWCKTRAVLRVVRRR